MNKIFYIYKITNIINDKIYIGQTNNIKKRWKRHISDSYKKNTILSRAMRKYGIDNFNISIIDICYNIKTCYFLEKKYIKECNSRDTTIGYNIHVGGCGAKPGNLNPSKKESARQINRIKHLGRKASDETKRKMREATGGIHHPMYGKHHSKKSKIKMSKARIGRFCGKNHPMFQKPHSEESKNKNRENHLRFIYEITFPDGHIELINSLKQFAKIHNLRSQSLFWCANKKIGSYKGFFIKKFNRNDF